MDLLERFLKSTKKNVADARSIPGQAVNFIDQTNTFQKEFQTFEKPLEPSTFTPRALNYFDELESKAVEPTTGFTRIEPDVPLNRWNEKTPYDEPGKPNS